VSLAMNAANKGPDLDGAGYCPRCLWAIDLHPYDAEGIDVGRCPTEREQEQLARMVRNNERRLRDLINSFPAEASDPPTHSWMPGKAHVLPRPKGPRPRPTPSPPPVPSYKKATP
jgi:hypothetical protein